MKAPTELLLTTALATVVVVQASFTSISVGGGYSTSSYHWACGLTETADSIECFKPYTPIRGGTEYSVNGRLEGEYTGVSVGGSDVSSYLYSCGVESTTGRIDCFSPYTVEDGVVYELKGHLPATNDEPYTQVSIGGAASSSVLAACAIREGGIDCFNPYTLRTDTETITPEIMGTLPGDYIAVSLDGDMERVTSHEFACATLDTDQVDCFDPNILRSEDIYTRKGHLPGAYRQISVSGGGFSSYVYTCASRTDRSAIDCFPPYTIQRDGTTIYSVQGSLPGSYEDVSVGGSGSPSYLYSCGLRESGVDCFNPYVVQEVNKTYTVASTLQGNYSQVAVGGARNSIYFYACAVRASGEAIDCFHPYSRDETGLTFEVRATYNLPTPQPSSSPTISPQPTTSPTTAAPTVSPQPTRAVRIPSSSAMSYKNHVWNWGATLISFMVLTRSLVI